MEQKKMILLLEKNNKYLVLREQSNNYWFLPYIVIESKEKIDNIKKKIQYKYGFDTEFCRIIDENDDFCFAKIKYKSGFLFSKFVSKEVLIPEIYHKNILYNKFQQDLIANMYANIKMESFNDALWLGMISKISFEIDDYTKKNILVNFLIFFSSIFCDEVLLSGLGCLSGKRKVTKSEIKKVRNQNLKNTPVFNSKITKNIVKEMGINFQDYTFDVVLCFINQDLIDINSRTWNYNKIENFELLNGCFNTPYRWIEHEILNFIPNIWEVLLERSEELIKKINSSKCKYKIYSTYKMFSKGFRSNHEKLYILQRYGLIKSVLYIDKIFCDNYQNLDKLRYFDFIRKIKSVVLEMIWNDSRKCNFSIIEDIFKLNQESIEDVFYRVNRKCRNNIHYGDYQKLTDSEIEILDKYQDVYLKNIVTVFHENIFYKFGIKHNIIYLLSKIKYWAEY